MHSRGCSISVASGSLLAELMPGRELEEARALRGALNQLLAGEEPPAGLELGELRALEGVRAFPVRARCALLAWTTFDEALAALDERTETR